jgi:hypothetical protein
VCAHNETSHGGQALPWLQRSQDQGEFLVASSLATTTFATTAAISTAAASIAAATTTAGRSRFARASLIHGQWPAFNSLAIEFRDGVLGVLFGTHGHKREATRFASEFILHEANFLHSTSLCEKLLQFVFRRVEGKIAYV